MSRLNEQSCQSIEVSREVYQIIDNEFDGYRREGVEEVIVDMYRPKNDPELLKFAELLGEDPEDIRDDYIIVYPQE